jgi:hypothetical protein
MRKSFTRPEFSRTKWPRRGRRPASFLRFGAFGALRWLRHAIKLKASANGKDKGKTSPAFDVRQAMANWASVALARIDGLGVSIVMRLLSEIGTDLSE